MATTVGEWIWAAERKQLHIRVRSDDTFSNLDGTWALGDFSHLLNGLSQRRIERSLSENSGSVVCELSLADGKKVQLIGAFTEPDCAQGILLHDAEETHEKDRPGPELVPVFQPILSLSSGEVAGFEALARWPVEGHSEEDAFREFDDKALATNMLIHACDALSTLQAVAGNDAVFMQVNLTSTDLIDDGLVSLVSALISGHDLKPGQLRLELTEQAALRDAERAIEVSGALKDVGAALVLDDFGSGHSSFLWLAELPAESLKVDSDLIAQIENDRVKTILEVLSLLARRLGMTITAEGVEDTAVLPALREIGFDYAQGYALGRPMRLSRMIENLIERDVFA